MLRTYLYIPDYLEKQINQTVHAQKKSKAEVLRQALEKGIAAVQQQGTASSRTLLKLAQIGKRYKLKGIHDSSRMDELLWSKDWSLSE